MPAKLGKDINNPAESYNLLFLSIHNDAPYLKKKIPFVFILARVFFKYNHMGEFHIKGRKSCHMERVQCYVILSEIIVYVLFTLTYVPT